MFGITIESSSFGNSSLNSSSLTKHSARGSNNTLNNSHSFTSVNGGGLSTPRGVGKIVPNVITREVNNNSPSTCRQISPVRSGNQTRTSPIRNKPTTNKTMSANTERRNPVCEEVLALRDENIKLRKEVDHMKLLLNCQKEENFIMSTSLFSAQEELKKLKTIVKKRETEIREQQEKMESLLSHSADIRPSRNVTRSPNTESPYLKKEVELLRTKLKASEEKFEKLKMINKETEDNIECLLNQMEHERVTKDQLLNQAKKTVLNNQCEKEKNDSFRAFLELYQENKQQVGEVELEDKFEQLLLAKQDLESKLFKREEQLIEMTMKFETARSELVKNSIM